MKRHRKISVTSLAEISGLELDDTFLLLWQSGLDEINDPSDMLCGSKLVRARRALSLPEPKHLKSLHYWQMVLSINERELRGLLEELGVSMSSTARTLPKGAIRKLKSFLSTPSRGSGDGAATAMMPPGATFHQRQPVEIPPSEEKRDSGQWRVVGQKRAVRQLKLDEVLGIHYSLVLDFRKTMNPITPAGPRSDALIASAVFRQHTSAGNELKYPSVEMCAAALLHSLVHNHPFHNGNKRTALVSMLVLLDENDLMVTCGEDILFQFVIQVSQHRIVDLGHFQADREVIAIAEWIKSNSRPIKRGERPIPFRKLRQILIKYGCDFDHSTGGSNMKITRSIVPRSILKKKPVVLTTNISYGGDGRDVIVPTINKIRAELNLDEKNGVDSDAFYADLPSSKDEFIIKYRKILNRLAKL